MFEKFIFFVFLGLSLIPVTGRSALVHQTSCPTETTFSCITAIDGLSILGTDYDMTVTVGEFNDLFDDPPTQLLSWGDLVFSDAANDSIVSALRALPSEPTSNDTKFWDQAGIGGVLRNETFLFIPVEFEVDEFDVYFNGDCTNINSAGAGANYCTIWGTTQTLAFATFTTASPVPIPAAVWLFGTALIGLVGISKRRKSP